jgi:hypothetical protein
VSRTLVAMLVALMAFMTPRCAFAQTDQEQQAGSVVEALKGQGMPIVDYLVFTAETDPSYLHGRPAGYTAKANFRDSRLEVQHPEEPAVEDGGSVEVFATADAARARSSYLHAMGQDAPAFAEYGYVNGPVLLRLSRRLTPAQAAEYKAALGMVDPVAVGEEEQP